MESVATVARFRHVALPDSRTPAETTRSCAPCRIWCRSTPRSTWARGVRSTKRGRATAAPLRQPRARLPRPSAYWSTRDWLLQVHYRSASAGSRTAKSNTRIANYQAVRRGSAAESSARRCARTRCSAPRRIGGNFGSHSIEAESRPGENLMARRHAISGRYFATLRALTYPTRARRLREGDGYASEHSARTKTA